MNKRRIDDPLASRVINYGDGTVAHHKEGPLWTYRKELIIAVASLSSYARSLMFRGVDGSMRYNRQAEEDAITEYQRKFQAQCAHIESVLGELVAEDRDAFIKQRLDDPYLEQAIKGSLAAMQAKYNDQNQQESDHG